MKGDTIVNVNFLNGKANDLHIEEGSLIAVEEPGEKMNVGIYMDDPGEFSNITLDYSQHFYSNNPGLTVTFDSDKKLALAPGKNITIIPSENGSVSADRTGVPAVDTTDEERTVTLTVTPDSNFTLKTLTVTTDETTPANVPLTKVSDTTYTFVMPDSDVSVSAQFEKESGSGEEPPAITAKDQSFTYGDSGKTLKASTDGDGTLVFTSDNTDILDFDEDGKLIIKKPGTVTVTITSEAGATSPANTEGKTVTVTIGKAELTITADDKSIRCGGKMPELTCTVSGLIGSDKLPSGFEPFCSDADTGKAGKYTIYLPMITDSSFTDLYDITYNHGRLRVTDDYKVIKGAGQSYVKGSGKTAEFTANGEFADFEKILVDEKDVSVSDYEKWEGSTCVRLSNKYLETLSVGKHKLTFIYTDGKCTCNFHVTRSGGTPGTGDSFEPLLWVNLMLTSGLMMLATGSYRKKKHSL